MSTKERRRYFRVDDELILVWRILSPQEKEERIVQFKLGDTEYPDAARSYLSLEADLWGLIQRLSQHEPEIARAIHLLNRKINLVTRSNQMHPAEYSLLDVRPQPVNISACGISFMSHQELTTGMHVEIEMILLPSRTYIMAYGEIVECQSNHSSGSNEQPETHPWRANVDFIAMHEDDRERLIQHVMHKESEMLKMRRSKKADN